MDSVKRLLGIRPGMKITPELEEEIKELTNPDAEYIDSLADDLRKLSDDVRHYAWCIQDDEDTKMQGKALVNKIQKVSTLFKKRFGW